MKAALVTLVVAMALGAISKADGFYCASPDGNLEVEVFNNVQRNRGTRAAARMIVSSPNALPGSRTVAVFSSEQGTLSTVPQDGQFLSYVGNVDLRFNNLHKDKTILSEPVTNLTTVTLDVDFNYLRSSLRDGAEVRGALDLSTRDGRHVYSDMACRRYLKAVI